MLDMSDVDWRSVSECWTCRMLIGTVCTLRPQGKVQAPNMTEDHHIHKWHYIEV